MKYNYSGIDKNTSQETKGSIDALNEQDALRQLRMQRIDVFRLSEDTPTQKGGKKVKKKDLVLPLQELATLTQAGVALPEAVKALSENKEHLGLAQGFKKIASLLESGESFSSAIQQSNMPFPNYLSHLVSAGEMSGNLALALKKASEQMNYEQSVANDIKAALAYPIILIGAGIAAMLIIFFAVVPNFSNMLDSDKELPPLAWLVLSAGKLANDNPLAILLPIVAVITAIGVLLSNAAVRNAIKNWLLNVPVIGSWLAEQDSAKWASLLGAMLNARVDLISALKLANESIAFDSRQKRAAQIVLDIQSGESLTKSLERAEIIAPSSLNLVAVGDKTGQLAKMMSAVASLHDEACKRRMKQVMTLVEPLAIIVVGVLIGTMIMGIVQAITVSTDIAI